MLRFLLVVGHVAVAALGVGWNSTWRSRCPGGRSHCLYETTAPSIPVGAVGVQLSSCDYRPGVGRIFACLGLAGCLALASYAGSGG
jgi:hypothetical protein